MALNFCTNCGKPIPEDAMFCPDCGFPIQQITTQQQPEQPPAQPPLPVEHQPQQQYEQPPVFPQGNAGYPPETPPPFVPEQPYQQSDDGYYANPGTIPPQYPPQKKSNGAIIALISLLALAALGAGCWALYNYVLKPKTENTNVPTNDNDQNSFSTETDTIISITDSVYTDTASVVDNEDDISITPEVIPTEPSVPKTKTPKNNSVEPESDEVPRGMTDEEAEQMQQYYNGNPYYDEYDEYDEYDPRDHYYDDGYQQEDPQNVRSIHRRPPRTRYNNDYPRRYYDEYDEMQQNNGDPWGMTDEEAQQTQRNQQKRNIIRRHRIR